MRNTRPAITGYGGREVLERVALEADADSEAEAEAGAGARSQAWVPFLACLSDNALSFSQKLPYNKKYHHSLISSMESKIASKPIDRERESHFGNALDWIQR